MRLTSLVFSSFFVFSAIAEEVHFGEGRVTVSVRPLSRTLLEFPSEIRISNCQLGRVQMDQVLLRNSKKNANGESEVEVEDPNDLKFISAVFPNKKTFCSFVLMNGKTINVAFQSNKKMVKNHIKFVPKLKVSKLPSAQSEGNIMDDFFALWVARKELSHTHALNFDKEKRLSDRPLARYTLWEARYDSMQSYWRFSLTIKESVKYQDIAKLKYSISNPIIFSSVLIPSKQEFKLGDRLTLFISANPNVSLQEIKEVLK